jgi:hypothetical protein
LQVLHLEALHSVFYKSSGYHVFACNEMCKSIKSCKKGAMSKQVDRKFVPLVCGYQLAIMDQHAADERVQLERLQDQVVSLITLDPSPLPLVLPHVPGLLRPPPATGPSDAHPSRNALAVNTVLSYCNM